MEITESILNCLLASRKVDIQQLKQNTKNRNEVYYLLIGQHEGFIQALNTLLDLIKKEDL